MHQCIKFILFGNNTLHVSDGLSVHYQKFKTVHTATSICQTDNAVCFPDVNVNVMSLSTKRGEFLDPLRSSQLPKNGLSLLEVKNQPYITEEYGVACSQINSVVIVALSPKYMPTQSIDNLILFQFQLLIYLHSDYKLQQLSAKIVKVKKRQHAESKGLKLTKIKLYCYIQI